MQSIEEFMREFLRVRLAEEKRTQKIRAPFRKKFYCDDLDRKSYSHILTMFQSEEIVSISGSRSEATVVTIYKNPFYKAASQMHRRRYHLKPAGESWLIQSVEAECPLCLGRGGEGCPYCKGKHWRREGLTAEERDREDRGNPPPSPP